MNDPEDDVGLWLAKAYNDLRGAQRMIDIAPPILDLACYHCQQTAEKALKGFLVFKHAGFDRTHNLNYLLHLCATYDESFNNLMDDAELLTPYAVEVRYPGDAFAPPLEEAKKALEAVLKVWGFVLARLPTEYHPIPESPS